MLLFKATDLSIHPLWAGESSIFIRSSAHSPAFNYRPPKCILSEGAYWFKNTICSKTSHGRLTGRLKIIRLWLCKKRWRLRSDCGGSYRPTPLPLKEKRCFAAREGEWSSELGWKEVEREGCDNYHPQLIPCKLASLWQQSYAYIPAL